MTSLGPVLVSISYIFGGYIDKSWGGMYHFRTALIAHRSCMFRVFVWTSENDSHTLGAYFW